MSSNKKAKVGEGIPTEDVFDFCKFQEYSNKYRYETRLIYAGRKDEKEISGFLYLATVAIKNSTNEICYISANKEHEEDWFKRVQAVNISSFLIEELYNDKSLKNSVDNFRKVIEQNLKLLDKEPFIAWELLEGGKNHKVHLEYIQDSNDYMKKEDKHQTDNLPYY